MKQQNVEIGPTRLDDYLDMFGCPPPYRAKAVTVRENGRVIGIGGLQFHRDGVVAFMDIAAGVDPAKHKRTLIRAARAVMRMAAEAGRPVVAFRDVCQERSESLLRHFGFNPVGETGEGEVWIWHRL